MRLISLAYHVDNQGTNLSMSGLLG